MGILKTIKNQFKSEKEETNISKESLQDLFNNTSGGVGSGFISDIYNEELQTPHNEMEAIREMQMMNAFVENAVSTIAELMLGKYQRIDCENEEQKKLLQKVVEKMNLLETMRINAKDFIAFGNFYAEKLKGKTTGKTRKFQAIAHPERMWRNIQDNKLQSYILQIPRSQYSGDEDLNYYSVGYGDYNKQSVAGVRYNKDEIIDGRMGQGDYKWYGRSPLASAISDHKILKEIERSMAIFSRFKSVPKKLISARGSDGEPLPTTTYQNLIRDWQQISDFENFVTNGKQFEVQDLDYSGNQVSFQEMLDYLKRKITSVLGPEFYFHGENTNYAVSNSQKTTFFLKIQSWREQFLEPFNEVLKEISLEHNYGGNPTFELGPFDFETDEEKKKKALDSFQAGLITIDEARRMMGIEEAEDPEVGRAYKWDVQDQQPMQPLQQKLEDMLEEE